jgi:hypothetical protein
MAIFFAGSSQLNSHFVFSFLDFNCIRYVTNIWCSISTLGSLLHWLYIHHTRWCVFFVIFISWAHFHKCWYSIDFWWNLLNIKLKYSIVSLASKKTRTSHLTLAVYSHVALQLLKITKVRQNLDTYGVQNRQYFSYGHKKSIDKKTLTIVSLYDPMRLYMRTLGRKQIHTPSVSDGLKH